MKLSRNGVIWILTLVILAMIDICLISRDLYPWHSFWWYCCSASVGVLPMFNILVLGLPINRIYPASRGFILGFEIIGMTLVGNYYAMLRGDTWVTNALRTWGNGYVGWVQQPSYWAPYRFVFASIMTSTVITLPMVFIASIAGLMTRNFHRDESRVSINALDEFDEEPENPTPRPATGRHARSNPS